MVRQKTLPRPVDTANLPPSQSHIMPSQQSQPQYGESGYQYTQSTSTPAYGRQHSQPFDDLGSPIAHDDECERYYDDGRDEEQQYQESYRTPTVFSAPSRISHSAYSGGVNRLNRTRGGRIRKPVPRKRITVAEREIKKLRTTTNPLIKLTPFSRIVKEIMGNVAGGHRYRISTEAIRALMAASEAILVTLFEASYMATSHARRVTLKVDDVQLVRRILHMFGFNF